MWVAFTNGETGGTGGFVVVDLILVGQEKFIPIAEAKRSSLEQAIKQCLLLMEDMRGRNGGGEGRVRFRYTGKSWQMLKYDDLLFQMSEGMVVLYPTMTEGKNRRIKDCPTLVDCLNVMLNKRCIVE